MKIRSSPVIGPKLTFTMRIRGDPESPRLRDLIQSDYEDAGKLDDENFAGACIYIRRPDISISS